jgi:protein ImuA
LKAGLDPARVLFVEMRNADETAWALEEGLKSAALIAALGQTEIKTPLMARRLGLAARAAGTPCFLLTGHGEAKVPGTLTRWRIATEASAHIPFDTGASFSQSAHSCESVPSPACWHLSLERSRASAQAGQRPVGQTIREGTRFHVQADHGTRHEANHPNTEQVTEGSIEEAAPNGLRVVPASANRETDAGALARGPQAATG